MNRYFDNASTSFPKPPQVANEISRYLNEIGGTYGRSAYWRVYETTRMVEACRDRLALLLGTNNPENISFCANATVAINTILKGIRLKKKKIFISPLEHNAVMRPLTMLQKSRQVIFEVLSAHPDGSINLEKLRQINLTEADLIIINHQSNVSGVIQPIADITKYAQEVPVLVDGSQSAGYLPIKIDEWGIDYFVFTGHKGLLGPTGTGGFFARHPENLQTMLEGGTGSSSDSFEMPDFMPDKFQAGTPNIVGMVGLLAAIDNHPQSTIAHDDIINLKNEISRIDGYQVVCAHHSDHQGTLFSLVHQTATASQIAGELFNKFGIEVRSGLHCAPAAHRFYGTFPQGTVRLSFSPYHTLNDLNYLLSALKNLTNHI